MTPLAPSLVSEWHLLPAEVRCSPAPAGQVEAFEKAHGEIPPSFRSFLLQCGGGVVGVEWVDGIDQLAKSHAKFQKERAAGNWQELDGFLIGWDGGGNPMLIAASGEVVVADHNFGGVHHLAPTFEEFLAKGLGHAL